MYGLCGLINNKRQTVLKSDLQHMLRACFANSFCFPLQLRITSIRGRMGWLPSYRSTCLEAEERGNSTSREGRGSRGRWPEIGKHTQPTQWFRTPRPTWKVCSPTLAILPCAMETREDLESQRCLVPGALGFPCLGQLNCTHHNHLEKWPQKWGCREDADPSNSDDLSTVSLSP